MAGEWLGWPQLIVALVALQRLAELVLAARNTRRLLARGGREAGRRHYPLFVLLHSAWLVSLAVLVPPDESISWPLIVVFLLLQAGRVWVIRTLGPRWTTRIIVVPGAALTRRGPYRFGRHPNYLIVALEIAVLPLAFGQYVLAAVFTLLALLLLDHRIRVEDRALGLKPKGRPPGRMARGRRRG